MHPPVAGGEHLVAGMEAQRAAFPIGDDTASTLDDGNQRQEIVDAVVGFHHQIVNAERSGSLAG